jgi:hypothetical protein
MLTIFFYIAKAFDKVWHEGLLFKMYKIGIPNYIIEWTTLFLENRKFVIKIENELSESKKITAGVPQGAVKSPILFSIFINDIPQNDRLNVKFSLLYADVLSSSFIFGKNGSIENSVNTYLRKIKAWLCSWKLNISANKCNNIVFTQNKKANFVFKLYLSKKKEKKLEEKNPVFLGVIFDKFLNFNTHFSNLFKK